MTLMKHPAIRWAAAAALVAAFGLAALPHRADAQTSGGNLAGRVQDDKKAPLPGVTINATEKATGFARSGVSGPDGTFRIAALPVGIYTVKAELEGFATVNVEEVRINVATDRILEVTMNPAKLQESITVVDEAPLVANSPSIGTVVSQKELEGLPLNGRQFANLASLAPGTSLSVNSDPTKPGQLTVALNGGSGRNVNYLVDGGDNTDDTIGGALQNFNLESVQEFKIQTQQYKAEYGRTTGGVLSVVTKTGTNNFAGGAYGFFRDKSLNSETVSERAAEAQGGTGKQPYRREQYGASFGGPIVQDKVHFFATWEKTDRKTSYSINTGGVLPGLDGSAIPIPFTDELGTAKLTYDISAKQYLQVRYGYQKNSDKYGASPIVAPSALGTVTNDYKSLLIGHTAQLGADSLNEALFQYTKFNNSITADSNQPTLFFPSGVVEGQNQNTPQTTNQTKYQFKDDYSWSKTLWGHRHDFKVGANYVNEPTLSGDFSVGTTGQFTLRDNNVNSPVEEITVFGGFSGQSTPIKQYSGYVQDDWYASDRLTVNVGLRYDLWTGYDLDQRSNPIWQVLSTQTKYHESYLRDFQGGKGGVLKNDTNNWAPRIGATWDLKGDGRHLLRGGWGIYYDFPYTNATILFPASAVQSNYGVVYDLIGPPDGSGIKNPDGTVFHPGQPLPPNGKPLGAFAPNEIASPTLATPKSTQASLGYSWEVNNWLGLNLEGVDIIYSDLPYRVKINAVDPTTGAPRFPTLGNFRLWLGNGSATYRGFNIGAHARLTKFDFQGFYTYSTTNGNVLAGADEFRLTDASHQPELGGGSRKDVSADPLDPSCSACFGPLNTDAKHRVTFAGTYRAPLGIDLSGIFRYRSAQPYMIRFGASSDPTIIPPIKDDRNGDRFAIDLLPGQHVNAGRGASFSQFDLRLSREFTFASHASIELIGEVFNVFNAKNPAAFVNVFDAKTGNPVGKKANVFAGDPLQGEQRLAQLGLRVRF
ncbi:MAG TPA: TonB-dependent receptor [Thermoanaerobaculia bacterium]|nr:TonB-dependent receptor [Thermoanaerobaculia bacterium]